MTAAARSSSLPSVDAPPQSGSGAEGPVLRRLPQAIPANLIAPHLPALPLRPSLLGRILHGALSLAGVVAFVGCMILIAVALGGQPS